MYSPTDEMLVGDYKNDQYDYESMSASPSASSKSCDPLYDGGESLEDSKMSANEYSHDNGSQLNNDDPFDDLQDSSSGESGRNNDEEEEVACHKKISDESSTVKNAEGEETPRNKSDVPGEIHLRKNLH